MTKEERKLQIEALKEEREIVIIQLTDYKDKTRYFQNKLSELDRMINLYEYYLNEEEK